MTSTYPSYPHRSLIPDLPWHLHCPYYPIFVSLLSTPHLISTIPHSQHPSPNSHHDTSHPLISYILLKPCPQSHLGNHIYVTLLANTSTPPYLHPCPNPSPSSLPPQPVSSTPPLQSVPFYFTFTFTILLDSFVIHHLFLNSFCLLMKLLFLDHKMTQFNLVTK